MFSLRYSLRNSRSVFVYSAKIKSVEVSSGEWFKDLKSEMKRNVGVKNIRSCWRSIAPQKRLAHLQRENIPSAELSLVTRGRRYQLTTSTFNRRASRLETACRRWLRTSRYGTARRGSYFVHATALIVTMISSRYRLYEETKKDEERKTKGERENPFKIN